MNKTKKLLIGVVVGFVNILLGAGGGIIAVPLLKKSGMTQKEAQANAIAVIFPITIISLIIYARRGYVNFENIKFIFPAAAVGALLGTYVFKKCTNRIMTVVFSGFMIWAGVRLMMK